MKRLFLTSAFLLLSSCQLPSTRPPVAIHFFDTADCLKSCWQNLRPGDPEQQVKDFYSATFSDFHADVSGNDHFYSANHKEGYAVQSYVADGQLLDIHLYSPSSFDLNLEKIIQTLGESKYTIVSYNMSVETNDVYPYIVLYYPEAGYVFRVDLPIRTRSDSELEVCIEKDALVSEIHVVRPRSIREVVLDAAIGLTPRMDASRVDTFVNTLTQWSGYACSTLTYPPIMVSP
ncbi:MAG: hypothetical protein ABI690_07660 [Chloroflexota bacterium]